jgi:hypothetical protein
MTEQTIKELVKSFAYGATPASLADIGRFNADELKKFETDHASEIEAKKAELKAGGWCG